MSPFEIAVVAAYGLVLLVLSVYGSHRYFMAYLYYRHKYNVPVPQRRYEQLPRVTVQLPVFNEMYVVERLIAAVCELDYPRDLLQIQVLDDSIDETTLIARRTVDHWRDQGLDIQYVHRTNRQGFKAGALENGLQTATGEFVAVFDADFVPAAGLPAPHGAPLHRRRGGHGAGPLGAPEPRVLSSLTEVQASCSTATSSSSTPRATARAGSSTSTARRASGAAPAIADAGGWQHDTLTEDLDLSYRAQLAGWKFVFLPEVVAPAELPVEMNAFKSQQHRWAKGSIQTAMKLLPRIFESDLPYAVKKEAFFHLTANVAYLLMILLAILMPITVVVRVSHGWIEVLLLDLPFFATATMSVLVFYVASQREIQASSWATGEVPALPHGARHRHVRQPGPGGGRGAAGPPVRLHAHAEERAFRAVPRPPPRRSATGWR